MKLTDHPRYPEIVRVGILIFFALVSVGVYFLLRNL